jgi:uncharacterized RDD family membrane protein YckC
MSASYPTPPPAAVQSNWGARLVAAIIDSIPWWIVSTVITLVLLNPWAPYNPFFQAAPFAVAYWWLVDFFILPLIYGVPLLIYSVVMEGGSRQATFGKKFMHLQVQKVDGGKPESGQILKRNISKIFWIIFVIDIIVGISIHGSDPRQRYFDRFAGTTVISTTPSFGTAMPPPPPPPPPPM